MLPTQIFWGKEAWVFNVHAPSMHCLWVGKAEI